MIIAVTAKGVQLKKATLAYINSQFEKATRFLPQVNPSSPLLNVLIKKSNDKYYPKKEYNRPGLAHFEGTVNLRLPKKMLYTQFKGQTIEECVNIGFKNLLKELKKYKSLHFMAQSEYPDHRTIRRTAV